MRQPSQGAASCLAYAVALSITACSPEAMGIVLDATSTASRVFKEAKDEERVRRDKVASERLGELSVGPQRLTVAELQALRKAVQDAKADGKVTLAEADHILIEMERAAALRGAPSRPR